MLLAWLYKPSPKSW